jgi:hypothetical protein
VNEFRPTTGGEEFARRIQQAKGALPPPKGVSARSALSSDAAKMPKKETFQSDRECSMQMTPLLEVLQVLCMANLEVIWWVCDECWPTGGLSAQQLFQMVVAPHPGGSEWGWREGEQSRG